MNSFRSFIRYLAPGISFLVEFVLLLLVASPQEAWCYINKYSGFANIAALFSGVIALGGFGYLISVVHHNLFWIWLPGYSAMNLQGLIQRLRKKKLLSLLSQDAATTVQLDRKLRKDGAWRVASSLWYIKLEDTNHIGDALTRNESLHDLMHGAGSALVACCMSIVSTAIVVSNYFYQFKIFWFLAAGIALFVIHWCSYRFIGKQAQGFLEVILFYKVSRAESKPVKIFITDTDLET